MVKLEFQNAVVKDYGYGMTVNGNDLAHMISTALGSRVDDKCGFGSGVPEFNSTCCNVTVIIDPQPVTTNITDDDFEYVSVEELEEARHEQFKSKNEKTDPEE